MQERLSELCVQAVDDLRDGAAAQGEARWLLRGLCRLRASFYKSRSRGSTSPAVLGSIGRR